MLEIIKTLCSRGDLNTGSLHTTAKYMHRRFKVKTQWKQIALQWAGSALYRERVKMLLQRNKELAPSEPRYNGDCCTSNTPLTISCVWWSHAGHCILMCGLQHFNDVWCRPNSTCFYQSPDSVCSRTRVDKITDIPETSRRRYTTRYAKKTPETTENSNLYRVKMEAFLNTAQCNIVKDRRFRDANCYYFYDTIWRSISEALPSLSSSPREPEILLCTQSVSAIYFTAIMSESDHIWRPRTDVTGHCIYNEKWHINDGKIGGKSRTSEMLTSIAVYNKVAWSFVFEL
jgi:hypothetical protein